MDRDNGILVGTPERLVGILTPMDFLRYLYQVASPFVMVSEIELALRALIRIALTEEQILEAAGRCLSSVYGGKDRVPVVLEHMTFDNYQSSVAHSENWSHFEHVFGGTRNRCSAKLKEIGVISQTTLARVAHPPIDRMLLRNLARLDALPRPAKRVFTKTNWTKLSRDEYDSLIRVIQEFVPNLDTFWRLEEYWTVTDDD